MLFQQALPQTVSALFAASLLVTSSWASPLRKRSLDRRQNAPFVVTGLAGEPIQPRLELRDLQQNADQWNIYLLGLQRMQSADQNDILSWFQISGILWLFLASSDVSLTSVARYPRPTNGSMGRRKRK
jgi:tyrosinase